ncbi:uncharacterized protein LOC114315650 [Camellia sinensis]|uniref:uncharacterized protein LOC114315650 n=1 Tax=Camellia sinensis TaxID=4442 RepID=UPI001035BA25|nr:uncharacterized protein LOC114315650 [Camellia sinensis]
MRELEFEVGDHVFVKVTPMKGHTRFGKKGKLSPRYIGPFQILERLGPVAYQIALPPRMEQVYNVFHVSMLRGYLRDPAYIIDYQEIVLDGDMVYKEKPIRILDRQVKQLKNKTILMKHIVHRFGLPQTIIVDQGTVFDGDEAIEFAKEYGIQMLNSSPYYAQANGQAVSSNKTIKVTLSKVIEDNPRDWHELLSEVLWANRNSKKDSIQASPYELVYGHAAVLPLEVTVKSSRVTKHYDIPINEYVEAMFIELQNVECKRIDAFDCMVAQKKKIERVL